MTTPSCRLTRPSASLLSALVLPLALGTACRSSGGDFDEVEELMRVGEFEQAVLRASELAEAAPEDAEAQAAHRRASAAWYLEQGRRLTFDDLDEEALTSFYEADALLPGDATIGTWITKSSWKLAEQRVREGTAHAASYELESAQLAFEQALGYWPQHERATRGLARVLLRMNYRRDIGEAYYLEGVRFLRELDLHESHHSFGAAVKYQGQTEEVARRDGQVMASLAGERMAVAVSLEEAGLFPAAHNEYRLVLLLDPDLAEAIEGRARTQVDVEVATVISDADMLIRRGRLIEAQELLAESYGRSPRQDGAIEELLVLAEETRLRAYYETALALEHDFRFEDAIVAYDQLLIEAEGYFDDALTRRDTLTDYVDKATTWYAEAEAARGTPEELPLLRRIDIIYPEYRDVVERIEVLEALESLSTIESSDS